MNIKKIIPMIALFMIFLIISMPFCFAQEMSLSYDSNGNLMTGDGKFRVYNSLNQLYRVYNGSNSSGTLLYEFKYHPLEERVFVKKSYNSSGNLVETVYYWSQNFITVVNVSGSYNFTYVYHNGELVAQQNPDGTKLFVLGDNKGSTSVITNGSGAILERTTYSPTGEVLSGGRLNRYGYEAKEQELGFGKVSTNGLVSYYALEGGAFDDGVGNQGTVVNATLTIGKVRDAYLFSGSSYVKVNDSNSLDLTTGITISAWIYPRSSTQSYVVEKQGAYMIQFVSGTNTTQGGIYVGGTWTTLATSDAIHLNTWTHVVFTYNKSNAVIYINGVSNGTGTSTSSIDTNNNPLWIGAKNSTDRTRDFNGSIDEVGVWNRALTSSEVSDLYNYGGQFDSGFRSTDFNFRRLNPSTGLFEQPDSLISEIYNPQSLNRYMFELGNPYRYVDPLGHIPKNALNWGRLFMGGIQSVSSLATAASYVGLSILGSPISGGLSLIPGVVLGVISFANAGHGVIDIANAWNNNEEYFKSDKGGVAADIGYEISGETGAKIGGIIDIGTSAYGLIRDLPVLGSSTFSKYLTTVVGTIDVSYSALSYFNVDTSNEANNAQCVDESRSGSSGGSGSSHLSTIGRLHIESGGSSSGTSGGGSSNPFKSDYCSSHSAAWC
jgi:RHS repeat-associated protein